MNIPIEPVHKDKDLETYYANLYHDINGNVFMKVNDILFTFTIDGCNNIDIYEINENKLIDFDQKVKYKQFFNTHNKKEILNNIRDDDNSDNDEDFQNYQNNTKYLEENKDFNIDDDTDDDFNDFDYDKVNIYKNNEDDNSIVFINKGFQSRSIFDTYVYSELENINATLISNDNNGYRISFYENSSKVRLNIVGSCFKEFTLKYDIVDNELEIIPNSISYKKA